VLLKNTVLKEEFIQNGNWKKKLVIKEIKKSMMQNNYQWDFDDYIPLFDSFWNLLNLNKEE